MKGFQPTEADQLKVQVIVRRLTPAAKRQDVDAFRSGIAQSIERYGEELTGEAYAIVSADYPWILHKALERLPKEMSQELSAAGCEVMAQVLSDAGLRLEDHLRIGDVGVALSHEAVAAIAATGFPNMQELPGNDSLEGVGLSRSPWLHPLSEFNPDKERMNFWAMASFTISAAQGWIDGEDVSPVAIDNIRKLIFTIAPTTDISKLMYRSKYDDSALLKLTNLLHQAITDPRNRETISELLRE